jgi:hypothetical protein
MEAGAVALEDPQLDVVLPLRCLALQIEQPQQRRRVGDAQVVTGEQAHPASTGEHVAQVLFQQLHAALQCERRRDRHRVCLVQQRHQVRQQRVVLAAADQQRVVAGGRSNEPNHRCGGEVVRLGGDDMPYAATWIRHVADVARNDVDMQVEYGLTRGWADVDADVVAVGLVLRLNHRLGHFDGAHQLALFVQIRLKPVGDMPPGDQQRVTGRDWKGIP